MIRFDFVPPQNFVQEAPVTPLVAPKEAGGGGGSGVATSLFSNIPTPKTPYGRLLNVSLLAKFSSHCERIIMGDVQ